MLGNDFNNKVVLENPEALICLLVCGGSTLHSASCKHIPETVRLGCPAGHQRIPNPAPPDAWGVIW